MRAVVLNSRESKSLKCCEKGNGKILLLKNQAAQPASDKLIFLSSKKKKSYLLLPLPNLKHYKWASQEELRLELRFATVVFIQHHCRHHLWGLNSIEVTRVWSDFTFCLNNHNNRRILKTGSESLLRFLIPPILRSLDLGLLLGPISYIFTDIQKPVIAHTQIILISSA